MAPPPDAITKLAELIDARNARTRRLCADQPELQPTYGALMKLEKAVHAHGWDQPPVIFKLFRSTENHKIRYLPEPSLTDLFAPPSPHPMQTLSAIADVAERIRSAAFTAEGAPVADHLTDSVAKLFPRWWAMLSEDPAADLIPPLRPDWPFYGFSLVVESFTVVNCSQETLAAAPNRPLSRHPERIEARDLHVIGRDGLYWWVARHRRVGDVSLPRMCMVSTRDEADEGLSASGTVPCELSRLTAAVASNVVPRFPSAAVVRKGSTLEARPLS